MAQITEIIMTAYERLQKLITDGDIYTKSQLDEKLDEIETKFGTEVTAAVQQKIDDGSLASLTIGNGTITSQKLAGNIGRILTRDCINITIGTTITVTILKAHNLFFDNNNFSVATQSPITVTSAETTTYCLYLNLNTSLLECKKIVDVNVPNIKIATFLNNTSTPFVILYGNDESIKVYNGDMQVFDKINSYQKGVISPIRKINILINTTSKTIDLAFLNGNTTVFANGISYSGITTKESLTYTVNALPFNLLYNIKTHKLFFSYANTDLRLVMGDNVIFICSFYTSGLVVDIASGSVHNILINGVDYFPVGSVDNTEVNPSSTLWNDPEYVFGINKNVANIPLEQVGSRVIKGMVSTVCSPNSRWNKVYRDGVWQDAYDGGKGGHIYEGFASDKSYRYTELLDYREDDDFPICSIQVFQRNGAPLTKQFGWTRIGTDDYSKTSYGYVGGWQFRDSFAYANCPTRYRKRPLPTKLPSNLETDIPLDDCPIIACDLNGDLRQWDYETKTWYKLVTEKQLNPLTMINNKAIGIENPLIMLPNTLKNESKIENGKIYQVKKIGSYTLDGTENWSIATNGDNAIRFSCSGLTMEGYNLDYLNSNVNMTSNKGICRWEGGTTLNEGENIVIMGRSVNGGFFVVIDKALATTVATFKTYLASNNIKVYYQLANEVTTEIIV